MNANDKAEVLRYLKGLEEAHKRTLSLRKALIEGMKKLGHNVKSGGWSNGRLLLECRKLLEPEE